MKLHAEPEPRRKLRTAPPPSEAGSGHSTRPGRDRSEDLHVRIAALAYQLYEQRGCGDGHELEDWLEAERRILGRMT
jgi:hypothetical protein